ncbi:MAG: alkene reductase [Neomegalonema sp.]|nr:alkene reductase [Neomegalonema sp.]
MSLFSEFELGPTRLKNRIVMAPMTRSRAIGNMPNALMAEYYAQRASAGLILTEAIAVSPNGTGYPRIPGLWSNQQVEGWRLTTDAVHDAGGKIFAQIFHTGRIGHALNLPAGGEVLGPSAVTAAGEMYTDQEGMQPHPTPRAMTLDEVANAREEFAHAAKNAIAAGFDGVELHAANGYLLTQFLTPNTNQRDDAYGGSIEGRNRLTLETADAITAEIGADRLGVRLSPHGVFNDLVDYPETAEQYAQLAAELGKRNLAYTHLIETFGGSTVPPSTLDGVRSAFGGTVILNGAYDRNKADAAIAGERADLIAFGVPFIANPDLPRRLEQGAALAEARQEHFYAPGAEGYTDYPALG